MTRYVLLLLSLLGCSILSCGGEVSVSIPGCESCPERCLITQSSRGRCVSCLNDQHCQDESSPTKKCAQDNRCICATDQDCPVGKYCSPNGGCVECKKNEHCQGENAKICFENKCTQCAPGDIQSCSPKGSNACEQGTQRCRGGLWSTCEGWKVCKAHEKCVKQQCVPDCPEPPSCAKGERRCISSNTQELPGRFQTCIRSELGCYEWSKEQLCKTSEYCAQGLCSLFTCPPAECQLNDTKCDGNDASLTCIKDKKGCLKWGARQPCRTGSICYADIGACVICKPKTVRSCYSDLPETKNVGLCKTGKQICKEDGTGFGACSGEVLPAPEQCDEKDNDCDGVIDNGFAKLGQPCVVGRGKCKRTGTLVCNSKGSQIECSVTAGKPGTELCDGKDNDCDGLVDEDFPFLNKPCKLGKGECQSSGQYVCNKDQTATLCNAKPSQPTQESCDGKDNDCDGTVDEGLSKSCYSGPPSTKGVGLCTTGMTTCTKGSWGPCRGETKPSQEACDGKDNDCDGSIDEDFSQLGRSCQVGQGSCLAQGTYVCNIARTGAVCNAKSGTKQQEICDGKDNDCDGSVDESLSQACTDPNKLGECKKGKRQCSRGMWGPCQTTAPQPEQCDGKDNDCDGSVDENFSLGQPCIIGQGACRNRGRYVCDGATGKKCDATVINPQSEVCDNKDNNCNGQIDEGLSRACYTGPLATKNRGVCRDGAETCSQGQWGSCVNQRLPSQELCDNKDNDCNGQIDDAATCPSGQVCLAGKCQCPGSVISCSGQCVNPQTDPNNCGLCGLTCGKGSGQVCSLGVCACANSNHTYCSSLKICANLLSDSKHCGSCGKSCGSGQYCQTGRCLCSSGSLCNNVCVNTQSDPNHCGSCGTRCPLGQYCSGGTCTCSGGKQLCGNTCVDTMTNPRHCGRCYQFCRSDQSCSTGRCVCSGGKTDCSSICIDTLSNPNHCGGCSRRCSSGQICSNGRCTCGSGKALCNGSCVDTTTNPSHCGRCYNRCNNLQCVSGQCKCTSNNISNSQCGAYKYCSFRGTCESLVHLKRYHCNRKPPQNTDWEHLFRAYTPSGCLPDGKAIWVFPSSMSSSSSAFIMGGKVARLVEWRAASTTWTIYVIEGSNEERNLNRSLWTKIQDVGYVITSQSLANSIGAKTIYRHKLSSYSSDMWSSDRNEWPSGTPQVAWWVLYATP